MEKSEVADKLGISVKVLASYLPYSKTVYNQPTRSANALKLAAWREKKRSPSNQGAD